MQPDQTAAEWLRSKAALDFAMDQGGWSEDDEQVERMRTTLDILAANLPSQPQQGVTGFANWLFLSDEAIRTGAYAEYKWLNPTAPNTQESAEERESHIEPFKAGVEAMLAALSDQPQQQGVVVSEETLRLAALTLQEWARTKRRLAREMPEPDRTQTVWIAKGYDNAADLLSAVLRGEVALDVEPQDTPAEEISDVEHDYGDGFQRLTCGPTCYRYTPPDGGAPEESHGTFDGRGCKGAAPDCEPEQDTPAEGWLQRATRQPMHDLASTIGRARVLAKDDSQLADELDDAAGAVGALREALAERCPTCNGSGPDIVSRDFDSGIHEADCGDEWHDRFTQPQPVGSGGEDGGERPAWQSVPSTLCGNCGEIRPSDEYGHFIHDYDGRFGPEGELVEAPAGEEVTVDRCPVCGFDHEDNDSGPGTWGGSRADMEAERARLIEDPIWRDGWLEEWQGMAKERAAERDSRLTKESVAELFLSDEVIDKLAEDEAIAELYAHWTDYPGAEAGKRQRYAQLANKPGVQESWKSSARARVRTILAAAFKQDSGEETEKEKTERAKRLLDEFGKAVGADESEDVRVSSDGEVGR